MVCKKCGQLLIDKANYCGYCGTKITDSTITKKKRVLPVSLIILVVTFLGFSFVGYKYFTTSALREYLGENNHQVTYEQEDLNDNNEDDSDEEEPVDPVIEEPPVEVPEEKEDGQTYIDFDNVYYNYNLKTENNAKEIIVADSITEKRNCENDKTLAIENQIIDNYGILAVNLCEIDASFAQELENVVGQIYNEFPSARGYLTNLTLTNTTTNNNYIAIFYGAKFFASANTQNTLPWTYKTLIGLNSYYYLNSPLLTREINLASQSGYFPKNATKTTPLAHEFGHYLSFIVTYKKYGIKSLAYIRNSDQQKLSNLFLDWRAGTTSLEIITEAYNNYLKNNAQISLLDFRSSISGYATAVDENNNYIYDETIAEAFHDYYINGSNAALASQEIVRVLKDRLSK